MMIGLTLGTLGHSIPFFYELVRKRRFCDCSIDRTGLVAFGDIIFCDFKSEKMMIIETKSQALIRVCDTFLMSVII